jgi:hypothetical protein
MADPTSTDRFERVLEAARETLADASDRYSRLESSESIPEWVVDALGEYDEELERLDRNLEVTDEELRLAERTRDRIHLLDGVLEAFEDRQRTVAEADVDRIRLLVTALIELGDATSPDEDVRSSIDDLDGKCAMLEKLLDRGRPGRVLGDRRFSPTTLEATFDAIDESLVADLPADAVARFHADVVAGLLDPIHEFLAELDERNDDKTAHGRRLGEIKSDLRAATRTLEDGDPGDADDTLRDLVDDCLAVHRATARAVADQQFAAGVASLVRADTVSLDVDLDACVARGDGATLLSGLESVVAVDTVRSTATRLAHLLERHEGSVVRTAEATAFDVDTILDHLPHLYHDGPATDVIVRIDR